jgi:hypothetical protein
LFFFTCVWFIWFIFINCVSAAHSFHILYLSHSTRRVEPLLQFVSSIFIYLFIYFPCVSVIIERVEEERKKKKTSSCFCMADVVLLLAFSFLFVLAFPLWMMVMKSILPTVRSASIVYSRLYTQQQTTSG